jgi:pimeloyl-ACP methyl ester carboxylesterase
VVGEGPQVVWLGGFHSEMTGTKAEALADWAEATGRAFLRFDYFGHGASQGAFEEGVITRWRADALAILDALTAGPVVLVGSSMGGWLACLAAMARPQRVKALVLIAPAADFTDKLLAPSLPAAGRAAIAQDGVWRTPSDHGDEGYPITRALLEDGARWSILPDPVAVSAPVRILQGGADRDVPWTHALDLARAFRGEDVVFTLIRDGDHRLSRPQDLRRLIATVEEVSALSPVLTGERVG